MFDLRERDHDLTSRIRAIAERDFRAGRHSTSIMKNRKKAVAVVAPRRPSAKRLDVLSKKLLNNKNLIWLSEIWCGYSDYEAYKRNEPTDSYIHVIAFPRGCRDCEIFGSRSLEYSNYFVDVPESLLALVHNCDSESEFEERERDIEDGLVWISDCPCEFPPYDDKQLAIKLDRLQKEEVKTRAGFFKNLDRLQKQKAVETAVN